MVLCDYLEGWEGCSVLTRGIYVYLQLIHIVVQQKSTQHCKAIILQLKINFKKQINSIQSETEQTRVLGRTGWSCFSYKVYMCVAILYIVLFIIYIFSMAYVIIHNHGRQFCVRMITAVTTANGSTAQDTSTTHSWHHPQYRSSGMIMDSMWPVLMDLKAHLSCIRWPEFFSLEPQLFVKWE